MKKSFLFLLCLSLSAIPFSQTKKKIDHTVYDSWNSIADVNQSTTGALITYIIKPAEGDGQLFIENTETNETRSFNRGDKAKINYNEQFIVFRVQPEFDTIRSLKLAKVKKDKMPKDTLAIYWPKTDSLMLVPKVKSFKLSEENDWLAYLSTDDHTPECEKKKCKLFKKKNKCVKPETSGTSLTILNPVTGFMIEIHQVVDYTLSKNGNYLAYVKSDKGEEDTLSIVIIDLIEMSENDGFRKDLNKTIIEGQLAIQNIQFDDLGEQFLFLSSNDTNDIKTFELNYWSSFQKTSKTIIDSLTPGMPKGFTVSQYGRPYFSRDGSKIFLGTNKIVEQSPEDTLLDSEKAKVDVWKWDDSRIQPQQLKALKYDQKKTFKGVYHIEDELFVQIADEEMENFRTVNFGNANHALGSSYKPYMVEHTWQYPWRSDVYFVDLKSGDKKLINEGSYTGGSLSPTGEYYVWFNAQDTSWNSLNVSTGEKQNMTKSLNGRFESDNNGTPTLVYSQGNSGWTLIDGKEIYIVNSEYDVWLLNPENSTGSKSLTGEKGKENQMIYRIVRFDYDSTYLDLNEVIMHGTNDQTKSESFYQLENVSGNYELSKLMESDHKVTYISKAAKSDQVILRRMSFLEYPEIEVTNLSFQNIKEITETNPQQADYNWGTVEFVEWTSFDSLQLKGLLYKPEDFDSTKSYPMIVYFYEQYSDNIHYHYVPKPTASIVYPTEYVSNGYIIFIPDIEYTPGHPAQSAYNCIVSGTDYLTDTYAWIDTNRLGLQGQSWGGYQTAQLITMTDKYAAAMAGAPVSNMFSAYGGVRWGSGLSRMFQYERTQSRIGFTIWERPDLYIENSPIFGLPNVNTPLLIMHNDGDGAVPWYQGIELYMGMRRLSKPAWMLNYNGDQHNLMKTANRKDLSIRMRQFFDYYLLGAPMPIWMKEGVPATNKGIDYGLELEKSDD